MRLIALVVVLLIIGLLVYKQLGVGSSSNHGVPPGVESVTPKVPTRPNDVKEFGDEMDRFMKEESERRATEIDEAVSQ